MGKENGSIALWAMAQLGKNVSVEDETGLPGDLFANGLADGGIVTAQITREPNERKRVNDPFRRVKIIPFGSVAEISGIGMMKVMITFAKTDEGH